MVDLIAKLISGDGITTVLIIVIAYLVSLWFMFSFWVYLDAKKRYKRQLPALILFAAVFIFNFPALVFYLVTRPENEDDFVILPADNLDNRGVNIPIVNFVGADGKINLSFELKINNSQVLNNSDMAINVDWKSQNQELKIEEPKLISSSENAEKKDSEQTVKTNKFKNHAQNSLKSMKTKVSTFKPRFSLPKRKEKSSTEPTNS